MPDVRNNIIWTLRDEVSASARKLNNELDKVGVRSKGATGALGRLGNVTGGLITPFSLGASAGLAFGAVMVNATQAAIEEEKNIAKLDAALRANITGWDGNTKAIEDRINASESLAFTDDELRDSLALLVAATKDVGQAERIQATAMDLARLKGISLKEASEALIKVEAGQFRMLKSLGIELRAGATQTEALAAVQKVATGQAEAFASTTEGKLLVAQTKLDDAMENLGAVTLPMVAEAANVVALALDNSVLSIEDVAEAAKNGSQAAQARFNAMGGEAELTRRRIRFMADAAKDDMASMTDAIDGGADTQVESLEEIAAAADKAREAISEAAQEAIAAYYDPIIAQEERRAAKAEMAAARRVLASDTATKAEKRDAREALREAEQRFIEYSQKLLESGDLNATQQRELFDVLDEKIRTSTGRAKQRLIELKKQLERVAGTYSINFSIAAQVGRAQREHRASGGPVFPGGTYTVGEEGPETLVMGGSGGGYVIPNGGGSGGSGGTTVVHTVITLDGRQIAEVVDYHLARDAHRAAPTALPA